MVAVVAGLIALNALFSGTEFALLSLRDAQVADLRDRGRAGAAVARMAADPNRYLASVQVGVTLTGFLASAIVALHFSGPLAGHVGFLGAAAEPVAVVLVTLVLTFVTLVFGELVPKRLAMQRATGWALLTTRPLELVAVTLRPLIWVLGRATDVVVRVFGGDPEVRREDVSRAEIAQVVAANRDLSAAEREIVVASLGLRDRTLTDVLVPRGAVVALPDDLDAHEGLRRLVDAGHSRAPIYRDDLDDIVGTVHVRDLIGSTGLVGDRLRDPLVLPESVHASRALRAMQTARRKLAVVIDEFGTLAGIVTTEDLVEAIVGRIEDPQESTVHPVRTTRDAGTRIDGATAIHELAAGGMELPEGPYTTVGGLVLDRLGRLAEEGDVVQAGPWTIEVTDVSDHRIRGATIRRSRASGRRYR